MLNNFKTKNIFIKNTKTTKKNFIYGVTKYLKLTVLTK
jgi:hypothetical protein